MYVKKDDFMQLMFKYILFELFVAKLFSFSSLNLSIN